MCFTYVEVIRARSRDAVVLLVVFSVIARDIIHLLILAIVEHGHNVVGATIKNVVNIRVCLWPPFRLRQEKMLVADSEAGSKVPATTKHVLSNIEVCGDQLRLAVARVPDAVADYVSEGLSK